MSLPYRILRKLFGEPLVSVIIPFYNRRDTLLCAVASVLGQTYGNIEVICVDDGSTDGSGGLLAPLSRKVRMLRIPHSGVSAARNAGLIKARGKYIMWCDADDEYRPEMVERMVDAISFPFVDMAVCDMEYVFASPLAKIKVPVATRRVLFKNGWGGGGGRQEGSTA